MRHISLIQFICPRPAVEGTTHSALSGCTIGHSKLRSDKLLLGIQYIMGGFLVDTRRYVESGIPYIHLNQIRTSPCQCPAKYIPILFLRFSVHGQHKRRIIRFRIGQTILI